MRRRCRKGKMVGTRARRPVSDGADQLSVEVSKRGAPATQPRPCSRRIAARSRLEQLSDKAARSMRCLTTCSRASKGSSDSQRTSATSIALRVLGQSQVQKRKSASEKTAASMRHTTLNTEHSSFGMIGCGGNYRSSVPPQAPSLQRHTQIRLSLSLPIPSRSQELLPWTRSLRSCPQPPSAEARRPTSFAAVLRATRSHPL